MNYLVLFIRKQMCILMLLISIVCNEIACCYNGKISKEDKVLQKLCDMKSREAHGV